MKSMSLKTISVLLLAAFTMWSIPAVAFAVDFQIGIFWPPRSAYTNATQYDYIRDANINWIQNVYGTTNDLDTVVENQAILDLCSTRGIKLQAADSRFGNLNTATDAEIDAMAADYKNHPATGGYYVKDEPSAADFSGFAHAYNRFLYNDADSVPNVNLLPTYANTLTQLKITPTLSVSQSVTGSGTYVRSTNPLGQTFITPDCTFIDTIELYIDSNQWSTSEALTLTIWNSPSKTSKIASNVLWGSNNGYYPLFTFKTNVAANTSYYWELTHGGGGDNQVGWVVSSSTDAYSNGTAYENGSVKPWDFYFKIYKGRSSKDKAVEQKSSGNGGFLSSTVSLGQTFKTPSALDRRLQFIELYIDANQWSTNEYLTMTVYDNTTKNQIIARTTMNQSNNGYYPRFYVNANLDPNTTYYFELTHNGGGDNSVGWVCWSTSNIYADGTGYQNGAAQGWDMYFRAVYSTPYQDYLEEWVDAVGASNLKYLSFDHYPYKEGSTGITLDYFINLEYVRDMGLKKNVMTACYLQSVGIPGNLRRPNENEMRYNVFTSIAYGVKSLNWFTWWTPTGQAEPFTNAIIDAYGNKTDLYVPVQNLNTQVKTLGPTLMGLTSQAVYHSGVLEMGTSNVLGNFFWKPISTSDNVIVSYFTNASGRKYILVVNRTLTDTLTLNFNVNPKPTTVTEVSKLTGQEVSTNYNASTGAISASFLPGEGRLYALPAGY